MTRKTLTLKIDEETFVLDKFTMGASIKILEFQESYKGKEIKLQDSKGIKAFLQLLVDLFDDSELTYEKILKVDYREIKKTFSLESINAWVESFEDSETETEDIEKKDPEPQENP